ncbi:hypothetical protein N6H14_12630 [Paenibacillus sp. CC-CFT747]|nr:hypothetical protein N6H14_12630 [Paenibacillus sp. CC-CFT747]
MEFPDSLPQRVTGKLTEPSAHSPGWIAYGFLERHKGLYGLKRVKEDLQITKVEPDGSSVIVYFQRMLYKTPVCDDQLVVELDIDGVIRRIEGTLHTGLEKQRLGRPMYPAVTQEEARSLAKAHEESLPPPPP